jgi:hypothetical protein
MHNFKVIFKLTILTVLFLGMIVYMTATPPVKIDTTNDKINMDYMPKTVKLLDDKNQYDIKTIIKNNSIIIVTNHDSIAPISKLDKHIKNFVIVANISTAPWFIKEWVIPDKLLKLKGESKIAWIYDTDGIIKNFLKIKSSKAVFYEVFKMKNNQITKLFDGDVKSGALDGSMSDDEIKKINLEIVTKINNLKG